MDALLAEQDERAEDALWAALRALEESADLSIRMRERFRSLGEVSLAATFEQKASRSLAQATEIRRRLTSPTSGKAGPAAAQ